MACGKIYKQNLIFMRRNDWSNELSVVKCILKLKYEKYEIHYEIYVQ